MFNSIYPSLAIDIINKTPSMPNVIHFMADVSGCSLYRMKMAEHLLLYNNKANVITLNKMIADKNFFYGIDVIRMQRQVTPLQLKYLYFLKEMQKIHKFRIIYEIDDIPIIEDIPEYNIARKEYVSKEIQDSIKQILTLVDEMTVTCDFMKQYFINKGIQNVTVLPNFLAKFWMGNLYNQSKINKNFDDNKKKPRILYCGSNAHYDLTGRNLKDDTYHVVDSIINTINEYQWIFLGGYPKKLKPYIESGKIEFHPWVSLTNYPYKLYDLNIQAAIAPLADNTFNRAKSDIKWTEMCAMGIPCVCQDLCTYDKAWWKFNTGDEMLTQLDKLVHHPGTYKNLGIKLFNEAEKWWLDNPENIGCYEELYKYPYGSPMRKLLKRFNNENR